MSAADLHRLFASTEQPTGEEFEGGLDLRNHRGEREGTVGWRSSRGTTHLTISLDQAFSGFSQMVLQLSLEDWLEIRQHGDMAFRAEGEYRSNELRRAK